MIIEDEKDKKIIPLSDFTKMSLNCLEAIKRGKGSFGIPEVSEFFHSFEASEYTARSQIKHDLTVQVADPNTFLSPELGFSIKSQVGNSSTFFNASRATNLTYRLDGPPLTSSEIEDVNSTRYYSDKIH